MPVESLTIYTDGAAKDGNGSWDMIVLARLCDGNLAFVGCFGDHVHVQASSSLYLGADGDVRSFHAEITGCIFALLWVAQLGTSVPTAVYIDNLSALNVADSAWRASGNKTIVTFSHAAAALARSKSTVTLAHVRGHSGNPWNELADRVAAAILEQRIMPNAPDISLNTIASNQPHHIRWAVQLLALPAGAEHLPCFTGSVITVQPGSQPVAGGFQSLSCTVPAAFTARQKRKMLCGLWFVHYNVRSLQHLDVAAGTASYDDGTCSGRIPYLDRIFSEEGADMMGFQEARTPGPAIRVQENYIAVTSGSCINTVLGGQVKSINLGCEVWIKWQIKLHSGRVVNIAHESIGLLFAEPRILLVSVRQASIAITMLSCHAPHSGRPAAEIRAHWKRVTCAVKAHLPDDTDLVICADINGRLGSNPSSAVGQRAAEEETLPGELFRTLCEEHGLTVPSTFPDCCSSERSNTWQSNKGREYRIDFTAIPRACRTITLVNL